MKVAAAARHAIHGVRMFHVADVKVIFNFTEVGLFMLAVEPDHAVVVGDGLQPDDRRDFLQLEGGAEPDLLFRDVVLRAPDPERLGRSDDRNEAQGEQAEQTREHGVMRG